MLPLLNEEKFRGIFTQRFWHALNRQRINKYDKESQQAIVTALIDSLRHGTYSPSAPESYIDYDKGAGVVRRVPVFQAKDYCVYFYCIREIERYIIGSVVPNTFGGWSLGGAIAKKEFEGENQGLDPAGYPVSLSYNPLAWSKYYGDFNGKLYRRILSSKKTGSQQLVVQLDIANYYDTIRLPLLERKIRAETPPELGEVVSLLFHFLGYWNRHVNGFNEQTAGLPQDALADCSRILAYFYLRSYDEFAYRYCKEKGMTYFRYADDQFIFVNDIDAARELVRRLSLKLSNLGLNINQKKVVVCPVADLEDERSYVAFDLLKDSKSLKEIEKLNQYLDYLFSVDKEKLMHKGHPLIRHFLKVNLSLLSLDRRTKFLALCFDEVFLTSRTDNHYLKRIYENLNQEERPAFIALLNDMVPRHQYSSFHLQLYLFLSDIKSDLSIVKPRLENMLQSQTQ